MVIPAKSASAPFHFVASRVEKALGIPVSCPLFRPLFIAAQVEFLIRRGPELVLRHTHQLGETPLQLLIGHRPKLDLMASGQALLKPVDACGVLRV